MQIIWSFGRLVKCKIELWYPYFGRFLLKRQMADRSCSGMLDEEKSPTLKLSLVGYEGRTNDVLYCPPIVQAQKESAVVYFGGDIQDFSENMESHRDNKNYLKWSLDSTAQILRNAFADCHIVVVRPSRMEYKTFSCFVNFVPSGNCGVPEHTPMHHSLQHLETLLEDVSNQLRDRDEIGGNKDLTNPSLKLIGFSKGCVVLNQFLHEFHTLKSLALDKESKIVTRIEDMYWLDGGHSGGKNTWITSKPILETLASFGIRIHIHVSPYQINDDRRPWIRKEEKTFYNALTGLNAPVQRYVHSPDMMPSIVHHFNILNQFYKRHSEDESA